MPAVDVMCVNTTITVVWTGLFVVMSYVQRDFSSALSGKDIPGFYRAIWKFVGIIVIAAPLYAYYHYMQDLLSLEWRVWLTEYLLSSYFCITVFSKPCDSYVLFKIVMVIFSAIHLFIVHFLDKIFLRYCQ